MKLPDSITNHLPSKAIIDAQFILSDLADIQRGGAEAARDNECDAAAGQVEDGQDRIPLGKRVE